MGLGSAFAYVRLLPLLARDGAFRPWRRFAALSRRLRHAAIPICAGWAGSPFLAAGVLCAFAFSQTRSWRSGWVSQLDLGLAFGALALTAAC